MTLMQLCGVDDLKVEIDHVCMIINTGGCQQTHRPMKHGYQHSLATIKYNRQSTDERRKKTTIDAMPQNRFIFKLLYNKTTSNLILKCFKLK